MIAALALAAAIAIPARPTDYVTDPAGVLTAPVARQIRDELRSYEETTKHHVIVWIGQSTGDTPLEDWTIHAAEQWKVGRKGVDDGVILFMFMRDHKVRIEVGYGLESALTDADASRIIDSIIVPRMRAHDPDAAVQGGVDRILVTITPSFASQIGRPIPSTQASPQTIATAALIIIAFILIWSLMVTVTARRMRRGAWYWSGSGMGWSSGGGGWSSGGGGSSGGSFGGSFGGGGASGGW